MAPMELTYFPVDGLAAPIRYAAAIGGLELEDKMVDGTQVFSNPEYKKQFKFRTFPVLKDGEIEVGQSQSILRYVGRKASMYPEDIAYEIDDILEVVIEFEQRLKAATYGAMSWGLKITMTDEEIKEFKNKQKVDLLFAKVFPYLESALKTKGTGFLCGTETPTIADCYVASFLNNSFNYQNLTKDDFADYPTLLSFFNNFFDLKAIKESKEAFATKFAMEIAIMKRMVLNKETGKWELKPEESKENTA